MSFTWKSPHPWPYRNRVTDDDARATVVAELRVVVVAECLVEGQRLRKVRDREIDEYLYAHECLHWAVGAGSS
jgi:hypothetical protein